MTKQITLEEALELVKFGQDSICRKWYVHTVKSNCGIVEGDCRIVKGYCGTVGGNCGIVKGNCSVIVGDCRTIEGKVLRTINGRQWQYVETPKQKLQRLIKETGNLELIDAFNQLEDNS